MFLHLPDQQSVCIRTDWRARPGTSTDRFRCFASMCRGQCKDSTQAIGRQEATTSSSQATSTSKEATSTPAEGGTVISCSELVSRCHVMPRIHALPAPRRSHPAYLLAHHLPARSPFTRTPIKSWRLIMVVFNRCARACMDLTGCAWRHACMARLTVSRVRTFRGCGCHSDSPL